MKFRCDRFELADRLSAILGIVPTTTPKPILGDFLLSIESGSLIAEATDLEISGRVAIHKVEAIDEGQLALPSNRLLSILKEIPEDFVEISSLSDTTGAELRSSGFEFRILGHDPAEFPRPQPTEGAHPISVKRDRFHDSLKRVAVATSRDPTRYQLNGVFAEIAKGWIQLTATDGKRLTHDRFKLDKDDGLQISATQIEGQYPNYRSVFPPDPKVRAKGKRSDLLTAARSASLTTDKQTATVLFKIGDDGLTVESNAKDIGAAHIQVPLELTGEPIDVRFNPIYLIEALRTFEEDEIHLELTSPDKPVTLKTTQNYVHLVMPLVTT